MQKRNIKLMKPQPSPKGVRTPLSNITNLIASNTNSSVEKIVKQDINNSTNNTRQMKYRVNSLSHLKKDQRISQFNLDQEPILDTLNETFKQEQNHKKIKQNVKGFRNSEGRNIHTEWNNIILNSNPSPKLASSIQHQEKKKFFDTTNSKKGLILKETQHYLQVCQTAIIKLNNKDEQMAKKRKVCEIYYEKLIKCLEQEKLKILLDIEQKYKCEIEIINYKKQSELGQICSNNGILLQYKKQLQQIKYDINQNTNAILTSFQEIEFRQVMNVYWNKIRQCQIFINKIQTNDQKRQKQFRFKSIHKKHKILINDCQQFQKIKDKTSNNNNNNHDINNNNNHDKNNHNNNKNGNNFTIEYNKKQEIKPNNQHFTFEKNQQNLTSIISIQSLDNDQKQIQQQIGSIVKQKYIFNQI